MTPFEVQSRLCFTEATLWGPNYSASSITPQPRNVETKVSIDIT